MDTWSTFRGTSCLWTKVRQCRWMGIRPSGLGLRLKSRHVQPDGVAGCGGARCPFVTLVCPFIVRLWVFESDFFDDWRLSGSLGVILCGRLVSIGDLLLVLALLTSGASESSLESSATGCGVDILLLLAADLVTGALYSRFSRSDGVGLGEITRGVAGTPERRRAVMTAKG